MRLGREFGKVVKGAAKGDGRQVVELAGHADGGLNQLAAGQRSSELCF
jgi:hypothetical protein